MTTHHVEIHDLCVDTPEGRPLLRDLNLALGHDRVALVGRNGVGKTTLLRILAGELAADRGTRLARVAPLLVRQDPRPGEAQQAAQWLRERAHGDPAFARALARDCAELGLPAALPAINPSRGEARKLLLVAARLAAPELLLLDEPSEGLDAAGVAWLCRWLRTWRRGAIVASHHRGLLRCFADFFVMSESGCSHVAGGYPALERRLVDANAARERQYVRNLNALADQEQRNEQVVRRRQRKRNVGRLHELDRCTSRMRLNAKRSHAQVSQARVAKIRTDRISAARGWAKATRRALDVTLPLALPRPELGACDDHDLVTLTAVGMAVDGRSLFSRLDLQLRRERLAIVGPNGAGKTTLLQVLLGQREPTTGVAQRRGDRIGTIAQGAADWLSDASLIAHLREHSPGASLAELAALLVAHKFPLALAERPLRSLSPGERVRAALICLFRRAPAVELLVLDEPSDGLDIVGVAALQRALRAWPGGLVVVSHDRELLAGIGVDRVLTLAGEASWGPGVTA